jgi:hypothetical protein
MKKSEIKEAGNNKWLVLHNEVPKFTCTFENKKFYDERTIKGLSNPTGDPKEVQLPRKMEKWLKEHQKDKIKG